MHELSLTRNIIAIACEQAGQQRVRAVHVRIGALTGVDVDAVRFCYNLCTEGTLAAGSRLEVEQIAGAACCSACQRQIALSLPLGVCPCEQQAALVRTAGDELLITGLEVDDV